MDKARNKRAKKYSDAQLLLSRAVNKSSELLFAGNENYEQAEHDLVDAAVSKMPEEQSLLMKARWRVSDG